MNTLRLRLVAAGALALLVPSPARSETPQTVSVPPDSPRWELQGTAKPAEHLGRACLNLDGGEAILKDFEMRDGVMDVDVAAPASRGFFGFQFRIADDGANFEEIYLRPHKSGLPDAMQYTPILNTGRNWQLYNGPGFTGAVDIPRDEWFHLRLEVSGAQAKLYVKDMGKPALVMDDLKSGVKKGSVALFSLIGATYFSGFQVRTTADAPWERHLPPMPPDTLTKWSLSPSYDALARDLERPLTASETAAIRWQDVEAEPPGFVVLYRYREAPHPRVTFQGDFSRRLEPQPGMKVVYARTLLESDRDQVKKLAIGYSDDVSVFLNGRILYRGRSAQGFRDPGFLGIVNPENDAVFLPLKKGRNELVLAVAELGGGWGFVCRLSSVEMASSPPVSAGENRVFELLVYHTLPGKVPELDAIFRDVSKLQEKHGLNVVGTWIPNGDSAWADTFVYLVAHDSREKARKSWAALHADPAFPEYRSRAVPILQKVGDTYRVDDVYMAPTDYSAMK